MRENVLLKSTIEEFFDFRLNKNQWREIERLFFDLCRRDGCPWQSVFDRLRPHLPTVRRYAPAARFIPLKKILIRDRFPWTSAERSITPAEVYLSEVSEPLAYSHEGRYPFVPDEIYIEEAAAPYPLVGRIKGLFPSVPCTTISSYPDFVRQHPFRREELKRPILFLIKQESDFIKRCPCTKNHLGCGYFILNLGFGCPFDCSYCYLQQYTNAPGIVVPANIDDFLVQCEAFLQRLSRPIRLGTGEFCDSLALEDITGYAARLADFFRDRRCLFELKTKSVRIDSLLNIKASPNIIISWSLNTQALIASEEKMVATLSERLRAAAAVQAHGYGVAFHFDPIVHDSDWEDSYVSLIEELYRHIKKPGAWISLGTLRSSRVLKDRVEQRFPDSRIFYGELLLGKDQKLRYPQPLRVGIYKKMIEWIRRYDTITPIYLCMEDDHVWRSVLTGINTSQDVERSLTRSYPHI